MARVKLAPIAWVVGTPSLADPAGTAANNGGNSFPNTGSMVLRIANSKASANAVATISVGGVVSGGTYVLHIEIFGVVYTTAAIADNAGTSAVATAVLAATQANGNTLSTDFPSATCVGAGTALPTGPMTLTFGGAGVGPGGGLQRTPISVTVDSTSLTGGGGYTSAMTTAGTGAGVVTVETPAGSSAAWKKFYLAGANAVTWLGPFNQQTYNQADQTISVDYDDYTLYTVTAFAMQNA